MKNINLQQVRYFQTAIKCASFSQAARLLYTTQSNVSKNIASLEDALGHQLFIRQKKGILPTQKAIFLNLKIDEVKEGLTDLFGTSKDSTERNNLNVGFCQSIFFPGVLPNFFGLFHEHKKLCDVDVDLRCYEVSDVISDISNGIIDLGFILSDSTFSDPQIRIQQIASDCPRIFYSENCEIASKEDVSVSDFANYPIITTRYLIEKHDYRMINHLPFNPQSIKIVNSYDDIILYLATGMYITVLRPYVSLAYNPHIKSFVLRNYDVSQGVSAIWRVDNDNKYLPLVLNSLKSK